MTLTVDGPAMMCPSQQKTFRPGWTSHTIRSLAGRLRARALLASASGEIMWAQLCGRSCGQAAACCRRPELLGRSSLQFRPVRLART